MKRKTPHESSPSALMTKLLASGAQTPLIPATATSHIAPQGAKTAITAITHVVSPSKSVASAISSPPYSPSKPKYMIGL